MASSADVGQWKAALGQSSTRAGALAELAHIGTPEAVAAIIELLDSYVDGVAALATQTLAGMPAAAVFDPVLNAFQRGGKSAWGAAKILGRFGGPRAFEALKEKALAFDSDSIKAVEGLQLLGTPEAVFVLAQVMKKDSYGAVQAAQALTTLGEKAAGAVPSLSDILGADSATIRAWAVKALKRIGHPAIPAMLCALGDPQKSASALAVLEHVNCSDPSMVAALRDIWNDPARRTSVLLRFLHRQSRLDSWARLETALRCDDRDLIAEAGRLLPAPKAAPGALARLLAFFGGRREESGPDLPEGVQSGLVRALDLLASELEDMALADRVEHGGVTQVGKSLAGGWADQPGDAQIKVCCQRIAGFGRRASGVRDRLRNVFQKTKNPIARVWVAAASANVEDDARPHVAYMLQVMHKANAGISGLGLASVVGFIHAWAAGSPAINAREAIVCFGTRFLPELRDFGGSYPKEVKDCLETISNASQE